MTSKFIAPVFIVISFLSASFQPVENEWKEYTPEGAKCSILMPGQPTKREKTVNAAIGEIQLNMFMFQPPEKTDPNALYMVSYSDLPATFITSDSILRLKTFFDNTRDGAIKNIKGKLLSETIINYKQYPGREQRVDFRNGLAVIKYRYYLVKNRLYTLQVITETKNNFNKSINKFMDSFKLAEE